MLPSAPLLPGSGPPARAFRPRVALAWSAGFGAFGLGLSLLYAGTGFGLPCPFRAVTGWDCPLCGGTRLGAALVRGDLVAAFSANPAVAVGLVVLVLASAAWALESVGGPRLRPPARIRSWSARIGPTGWPLLLLGLAVGYTVLRNLVPVV